MRPVEGLRGTAMVAKGGSVEADLAAGLADVEAGVACTSGTRFQLCSVSKQFAAAAVMLLVESGQLDLRRAGRQVAAWRPPQWRQVTLHHLLSHTAGIPHWLEAPGLDPAEPMGISERLEIIQATPLRTEPGAQWHYSSPGFVLAGLHRGAGQRPALPGVPHRADLVSAAADPDHRGRRPGRRGPRLQGRSAGGAVGPGRDARHRRHLVYRRRPDQVHRRLALPVSCSPRARGARCAPRTRPSTTMRKGSPG